MTRDNRKPQPARSPLADVPLAVRMLHAELEIACGRGEAAMAWMLDDEERTELRARVKAFRVRPARGPTTP